MSLDIEVTRRRFTVDEYHRMIEVGLLHEDDRVELIRGEIVQMALHHPVRLAIQLDNLSRGRLEVGIGRGSNYNEYEYVGFGLRSDDSRERMDEAVEVLTGAWTEEPFVHDGKFFSVRLPAIRPRPVQRPHPPIWRSVISPESLVESGRDGLPVMMSRVANARIPERLARYREGLEAGGHEAATARHSFRGVGGAGAALEWATPHG